MFFLGPAGYLKSIRLRQKQTQKIIDINAVRAGDENYSKDELLCHNEEIYKSKPAVICNRLFEDLRSLPVRICKLIGKNSVGWVRSVPAGSRTSLPLDKDLNTYSFAPDSLSAELLSLQNLNKLEKTL